MQQALSAAREAGKDVTGLAPEKRETAILLENWGYLPVDQSAVDAKVQEWYISQGLAQRPSDTPAATPDRATAAAFAAAESALATAQAMLALARMRGGGGALTRP